MLIGRIKVKGGNDSKLSSRVKSKIVIPSEVEGVSSRAKSKMSSRAKSKIVIPSEVEGVSSRAKSKMSSRAKSRECHPE